ncbi:MAG TPA: helix-hairpin-helix domain-containing protein [Terracidiphilus sp.]|nr:helix-hairpin-helix domain-containing protein [Terracidiphilus sp.]
MSPFRAFLVTAAAAGCLLAAPAQGRAPRPAPPEMRVDINHASLEGLMKVPGMTGTWAARIVRFRPYRAKNDLLERGVVPSEVYERIKDNIIAHREKQ